MRAARRLLAGVLGLALLGIGAGIGTPMPVQETMAAYTDTERATAVATTIVLQPPTITGVPLCRSVLLGGDVVQITWTWPSATPPYNAFPVSNAQWKIGTGEWQSMPTTGPVNGVYTTTFTNSLLSGLLGSLLGQSFTAKFRTGIGAWTSATERTFTYTQGLLGPLTQPTCTYS
ncbi:hypothetical protein K8F61_18020 [Microbacterium resistens]|uniref:Uncharacterized protein n=1 Tax=Microbacterium resistens TaxID=156977 RepID=A0ABY3RR18_9MICO|nr:hypothetical protein [Microbacterium resistens]UGS26492.1 hypothetical protein K8F61_18020 [Microbacterium resistens]